MTREVSSTAEYFYFSYTGEETTWEYRYSPDDPYSFTQSLTLYNDTDHPKQFWIEAEDDWLDYNMQNGRILQVFWKTYTLTVDGVTVIDKATSPIISQNIKIGNINYVINYSYTEK